MTNYETTEDHDDESWIDAVNATLRELRELDIERAIDGRAILNDSISTD